MTRFGRRLRRRQPQPLGSAPLPGGDFKMLMAGKAFLRNYEDVFSQAEDNVLAIVDLRDTVGQSWFGAHFEIDTLDALHQLVTEITITPNGTPNPHPFVAFWAPRHLSLLEVLTDLGFGVPPDWFEAFERPPAPGCIWTILKRGGRGQLMHLDYSNIPALEVPSVNLG